MKKLLVTALIIGAPVWWFWGRTFEAGKVVESHIEAIGKQDYERAYSYLSSKAKSKMPLPVFIEEIQKNPVVASNYASEFLSRKVEGSRAVFTGHIRALGSQSTPATYVVVKEGGRWYIQEFRF